MERALLNGRCPEFADGLDGDAEPWPAQPLLDALSEQVMAVGLPRAAAKHPSIVPSALAAVLDLALRWESVRGSGGVRAGSSEGEGGADASRGSVAEAAEASAPLDEELEGSYEAEEGSYESATRAESDAVGDGSGGDDEAATEGAEVDAARFKLSD